MNIYLEKLRSTDSKKVKKTVMSKEEKRKKRLILAD